MSPTASDLADPRARVREILLSAPCRKIDFDFCFSHGYGQNRCKIDGFALSHVALALGPKPIAGRGIRIEVGPVKPVVGGTYDPATNVMRCVSIFTGLTDGERALIVDESVHSCREGAKSHINGAAGVPFGRTCAVEDELGRHRYAARCRLRHRPEDLCDARRMPMDNGK